MWRFILIVLSIIFLGYFLRGIIRIIAAFLNSSKNNPVENIKPAEKKSKIQYDKSKVVDADFEDIK
ncbi:MAG TPA: hypothetical protein VIL99_13485 [Ignavibacteria bacterium]